MCWSQVLSVNDSQVRVGLSAQKRGRSSLLVDYSISSKTSKLCISFFFSEQPFIGRHSNSRMPVTTAQAHNCNSTSLIRTFRIQVCRKLWCNWLGNCFTVSKNIYRINTMLKQQWNNKKIQINFPILKVLKVKVRYVLDTMFRIKLY